MIHITNSEWEIMEILWQESPLFSKEIKERLIGQSKSISTIKTLINRLVQKEAIGFHVSGKSFQYYPTIQKEDAVKAEHESFIRKVFRGSKTELIMNLVKETTLTNEDIDKLRQLLEKKRES